MNVTSTLAGVRVGDGAPVRVMGVINVSPESFYRGSVETKRRGLLAALRRIEGEGADFVDVGAMSTAPYLETAISEEEEAKRLAWAVGLLRKAAKIPISADTTRARPAEEALKAGATIINDVSGLRQDPRMGEIAARAKGLILMANPMGLKSSLAWNPVRETRSLLADSLRLAARARIPANRIVLDPGIGFFRNTRLDWWRWDLEVLRNLGDLTSLKRPILLGVSRKSFISQVLNGRTPEERLFGSLSATAVGVMNGADIIRTHDVQATGDAARVAQTIKLERISYRSVR